MANDVNNTMTKIVIDDGSVRIPIENNFGEEIGVFQFRPTDVGIIERYNKMAGEFENIVAPLENVSIKSDGTGETDVDVSALKEAEQRLFDAYDYMSGGNMSEAFFGKMNPFSPVGGEFYAQRALNAVGRVIEAHFNAEIKKINTKVSKYTSVYQKKGKK